jgi:intracellular sulfur oxidation DsrE/DsrF family protein
MLRRTLFSRFGGAVAAFGFVDQQPAAPASASPPPSSWRPARHDQDNWFDDVPGSHRVVFDTWLAAKFQDAITFTGNYRRTNRDAYGLTDRDLAVVIVVRHRTAPFAFNDAIWAKYGKAFSNRMEFTDPKTHEAPTTNIYGAPLTSLIKEGTHLAVCNLTTRSYAQRIADETHTAVADVYKELTANTLGNAHFVPAGIVAVSRAQERGYSLVSIG